MDNAYVNVLGLARNRIEFRNKIERGLIQINFKLIRLEKLDVFSDRIMHYKVDRDLHQLANELIDDTKGIKFSTFHTYD